MEVTKSNFKEVLPVLTQCILDSSFVAIDTEFSGLTSKKRANALDTCEERYQKLANGVKDFMILQFGLCTFSWDDEQRQYVANPFNFYIFPKPYNRQMPDMRFLCQSSSLAFLADQNFDFNKWISEGIPFLLPPDEERLRRMVASNREQPTPRDTPSVPNTEETAMPIPPHFEKTMELIMTKVENFVKDPEQKSLNLPPSTPLLRKLVFSSVKAVYKTGLHLESKHNEDNDKFIVIMKCSEQEKVNLENEKFDREQDGIEEAVGFTKVIRLLSQSGKVIVGHNMLLDLLHMIRLFVAPLPNDLAGFKALVKCALPRLIDTKVMSSTAPIQGLFPLTHLEKVYEACSEAPFVKPNVVVPRFDGYSDVAKAHEAGYDAYMTGVAFAAMASYLEKQRDGSTPSGDVDFDIVKPFLNKIFLFPRMEDIPYLNLDDKDLSPNRDHVFHVEHPDSWQFADIQKLFKDFGYVYITKVGTTSAFVSLTKRERATRVMQRLNRGNAPYVIQTYNEYHGIDGDDGRGGKRTHDQSDQDHGSFLNHSSSSTTSFNTPSKTPETVSVKRSKDDLSPCEVEEGELPQSPGPAKKKIKGQHTFFEEPTEWF